MPSAPTWRLPTEACVHAKSSRSCTTLCNTMDRSPPGSSVPGILQARIPGWVAVPSSREILPTQEWNPRLLCLLHSGGFFKHSCQLRSPLGVVKESESEATQSCPTLCDPMDCRLPGSSVHGIFQARILEWVAISFSRGSSRPGIKPGSPAIQADLLGAVGLAN